MLAMLAASATHTLFPSVMHAFVRAQVELFATSNAKAAPVGLLPRLPNQGDQGSCNSCSDRDCLSASCLDSAEVSSWLNSLPQGICDQCVLMWTWLLVPETGLAIGGPQHFQVQ